MKKLLIPTLATILCVLQGCKEDQKGSNTADLPQLSQSVQCFEGTEKDPAPYVASSECIRAGIRVIDQNRTMYEITRPYSDGRADASYSDYNGTKVLAAGTYYPEVYQINGFGITKESSDVIDGNNTRYSVSRIFSNGQAQVAYRDYNGNKFVDIRLLAVSVPSFGGVKAGDRIIDGNNIHYSVETIYSDGRIYAAYTDYNGFKFLNASQVSVGKP